MSIRVITKTEEIVDLMRMYSIAWVYVNKHKDIKLPVYLVQVDNSKNGIERMQTIDERVEWIFERGLWEHSDEHTRFLTTYLLNYGKFLFHDHLMAVEFYLTFG